MTFKKILTLMKEFEISTVLLIAGFGLLRVVLALICIWVVALLYSGLTFEQYCNILLG
jgi:hypothetical protein